MTQTPGVGEPGAPRGMDGPSSPPGAPLSDNPFAAPAPGTAHPPFAPPAQSFAPPQAPPPGQPLQPGQYPPPGWQQPPAPPGTNVLAVVSFVLGLLSITLVSYVLAIIALVQIRRRGQKGRVWAWLGIVLSTLWLIVLIVFIVAVAQNVQDNRPQRDASGQITKPAEVQISDLRAKDCIRDVSEGDQSAPLTIVPCSAKHGGEVFAVFELPSGGYPGEAAVRKQADAGCVSRFKDSATSTDQESEIWYLYPGDKLHWRLGGRSVACLTSPTKK